MSKITQPITVGSVQKNSAEEVRATFSNYRGHDLFDLRVYGKFGAAQTFMPSGKGVSVNIAKLPELIALLQQAEAEARSLGLIGGAE